MTDPAPSGRGLGARLRDFASTVLAIAQTRLELLATEVEEEKCRVGALLGYAAAAFFLLGFGSVFLALFLTLALWDTHRLLVLGIFTALFLALGVIAVLAATRLARQGSRLFSASLAELAQDREALRDKE